MEWCGGLVLVQQPVPVTFGRLVPLPLPGHFQKTVPVQVPVTGTGTRTSSTGGLGYGHRVYQGAPFSHGPYNQYQAHSDLAQDTKKLQQRGFGQLGSGLTNEFMKK